jgi:hypothetical protein
MIGQNHNYTPLESRLQDRRSDYDVTNTIKVSSVPKVRSAVCRIFSATYPEISADPVWVAFYDFERYFYGHTPDYHAVDTTYHDVQHTLDMTLAAARLIAGYEQSVEPQDRIGPERTKLAIVCSLFHDFGYLRHKVHDRDVVNGAEFTRTHVSRSGRFLEAYLPTLGLEPFSSVVARIVHFTGYEVNADAIELEDPRDSTVGHLIGTADLLAQMSDRCYLEKCRDRLYPEFVLGNVAIEQIGDTANVRYVSGVDLLSKTLQFFHTSAQYRLDHTFNRVYRYMEAYFQDGLNPYMYFIDKNVKFLQRVIESQDWQSLRRKPPCEVPDPEAVAKVIGYAEQRLKVVTESTSRMRRISIGTA